VNRLLLLALADKTKNTSAPHRPSNHNEIYFLNFFSLTIEWLGKLSDKHC